VNWRNDAIPGTYAGVVRASWINLLVAIVHGLGVEWLTHLDALNLAENKAFQLLVARRIGLRIPVTTVASDRDRLPSRLGDPMVVKPLGPGAYRDADGGMHVIHANLIDRASEALEALAGAPFLVQERLAVEQHLRVVTVGKRAWCGALAADGLPLDWRRDEAAHDAFRPAPEFNEVHDQAVRLASALHAGYSSQDWVVVNGAVWFLEFNPGGQWLFLPAPVADEITAAIVEWLMSAEP
jgi:glutathione synthase/RimK-type ligase-like ATP-grasp enzyme